MIDLRESAVRVYSKEEIEAFVKNMKNSELSETRKNLETDLEDLQHYTRVKMYLICSRSLDVVKAEIIERESRDGVPIE